MSWYPDLSDSSRHIERYFTEGAGHARALGFFHALAAVALLCFAAHVRGLLARHVATDSALPSIAFGGALMAAAFMLLSALLFTTLSLPETARDPAMARALLHLSYAAGGPAIALPLSLFIATTCLITLDTKTLPGWLGRAGLVAAALSVLSSATLLVEGLGLREEAMPFVLLPLGMVLSFGWVLLTSAALMLGTSPLPKRRGDL